MVAFAFAFGNTCYIIFLSKKILNFFHSHLFQPEHILEVSIIWDSTSSQQRRTRWEATNPPTIRSIPGKPDADESGQDLRLTCTDDHYNKWVHGENYHYEADQVNAGEDDEDYGDEEDKEAEDGQVANLHVWVYSYRTLSKTKHPHFNQSEMSFRDTRATFDWNYLLTSRKIHTSFIWCIPQHKKQYEWLYSD